MIGDGIEGVMGVVIIMGVGVAGTMVEAIEEGIIIGVGDGVMGTAVEINGKELYVVD